ncbi:MAG TPA: hypothetical protein VG318_01100 [Actinomycetota bacterium]|nr:hypothetical protein [Actinomycetota bacterium]
MSRPLRLPFRCECGILILILVPRRRWAEIAGDIHSPEYLAELDREDAANNNAEIVQASALAAAEGANLVNPSEVGWYECSCGRNYEVVSLVRLIAEAP